MPDLTPYIARRQLQRTGPGGGGGGVGLPRVPDVSGIFRQTAAIGEELGQLGATLATVARQRQRAQDTATLTAAEASIDEELAATRDALMADQSQDPWTYRETLSGFRDHMIEQRSATLPGRLQPTFRASIMKSTQAQMINVGAEGSKRGIARAMQSFDVRQEQLQRQWLTETDPMQRLAIEDAQRELTASYVGSGIISEIDGKAKLMQLRDTMLSTDLALKVRQDPDGMLKRLQANEFPNLPGEQRVKLIDQAQTERKQQFEWGEAVERRAERERREQQGMNASQARADVLAGKLNVTGINRLRANRDIDESDHSNLINFKLSLDRHRESGVEHKARMTDRAQEKTEHDKLGWAKTQVIEGQMDTAGALAWAQRENLSGKGTGQFVDWVDQQERQVRNETKTELRAQFDRMETETRGEFVGQFVNQPRYAEEMDQVYSAFRIHARSLSKAWSDDPEAGANAFLVKEQIIDEYRVQARTRIKTLLEVTHQMIPERYRPSFTATFEEIQQKVNQLKQDALTGRIKAGEYHTQAERLRELSQVRAFEDRQQADAAAKIPPPPPARRKPFGGRSFGGQP